MRTVQYYQGVHLKKDCFHIHSHKGLIFITAVLVALALSGCGESKESAALKQYHSDMETVLQNISDINTAMNSIDAQSETATDELLSCFDSLEAEFSTMAGLTAPNQFSSIDELADEAMENMISANEMYHEAFSNGSYNEYIAEAADEYYARVNKRLRFIIQILHGETPEGDGVTVIIDSGVAPFIDKDKTEETGETTETGDLPE